MKRIKILGSKGDTIVEVMIVLTVLSLALSIASATANKSLQKSRNAEERSQATGIINSQIELVRSAVRNRVALPTSGTFCMTSPTAYDSSFPGLYVVPEDAEADIMNEPPDPPYPAACIQRNYYHTSIVHDSVTGDYRIRVRWVGVADLGMQQVETNYRTHELAPGVTTIPITSSTPQLTVKLKVIPELPGNYEPPCTNAAGPSGLSGVNVTITQTNGPSPPQTLATGAGGSVLFTTVLGGGVYKADYIAPAGFTVCNPKPSGAKLVPVSGTPAEIEMKVAPQCWDLPATRDSLGVYADSLGTYRDFLGNYADSLGVYSDTWPIEWWEHTGADDRHDGWWPLSFETTEGGIPVQYRYRSDIPWNSNGYFFERWEKRYGTDSGPPYEHFTAPYDHWSAEYEHFTAPYEHFGPWYTPRDCTNY